jgi:hypothetical protein
VYALIEAPAAGWASAAGALSAWALIRNTSA